MPEGTPEGTPDGKLDGKLDGMLDGRPDGMSDGKLEGTLDGMFEGNEETPKEGEEEGIDDGKLDPVGVWPMAQPAVKTRIEKDVFIFSIVVKISNVCDSQALLLSYCSLSMWEFWRASMLVVASPICNKRVLCIKNAFAHILGEVSDAGRE